MIQGYVDTGNKDRLHLQQPWLSRRNLRWSWNEAYITNKWNTASWCARNSCEKRYFNYFYLRVIDHKRSATSLYSTKSWSRINSLRQFRWFALKYFIGLHFKYFINLRTKELGGHCHRSPPGYAPGGNRILIAGYRSAQAFVIYVHTDSVIQINQHNYQQSWLFSLHRNLYTVSTDSPVIMFVILIYSLTLCWGNVSKSNVTMKFAQHYFLWQNVGGNKIYYVPPCPKVGWDMSSLSPHKLGSCLWLRAW